MIAGIYEGIRNGAANNERHFALAAGREHQSWGEYFGGSKTRTGAGWRAAGIAGSGGDGGKGESGYPVDR